MLTNRPDKDILEKLSYASDYAESQIVLGVAGIAGYVAIGNSTITFVPEPTAPPCNTV